MKNKMNLVRTALTLTLALAAWSPLRMFAADPAQPGKMPMEGKMMESHQTMTESPQAMMQRHQAMMADMKAKDAELTAQVAKMNSAPTNQKLDLLAAIVTRLVEQRTAMTAHMGMMQEEMMKCTMPGMPMGKESMSKHPMKSGMDDKTDETKKSP